MDNENSAHQVILFQDAQAMYYQGQLERQRDAAGIAEMALSTFTHRMAGRRSAEDYGKTRRLLTAEESILMWRCDVLQRSGWSQNPGGCADKKIKRVQEKVKKVEEKIADLVAKLNKHSERHASGKLPTKWHMPS